MESHTHDPQKSAQSPVYIVDGARTPFLKVRGQPGPFTPVDLAVQCGRPLLLRQPIPLRDYDRVILGCVNVVPNEMNPARIAALRMGLPESTVAYTVQINCGSGMQSIENACQSIRSGQQDLILAGGTEALSHAPMVFRPAALEWLADIRNASNPQQYARTLADFKISDFIPQISLEAGLTDPLVELGMGQTAEVIANLMDISRQQADEYAVSSHQRLHRAQENGWLDNEVEPAIAPDGRIFYRDDGVRPDSSVESLAKLSPAFEKPFGQVTAGNSSQVTDGASWLILASETAVKRYGLQPRAIIRDSQWSALDPAIMGLAPTLAMGALLQRQHLGTQDIERWELNEAFAAQVLAVLKAWQDPEFISMSLGLDEPFTEINRNSLNVDGGAVALGHPVGASGNRIMLHLVNVLQRDKCRLGIASECIGGGQAGAMLVEAIN